MKLSKSIIVTGLLFSSILGGVNVNNIVSYAVTDNQQGQTEEKTVEIKYVDVNKKEISDASLKLKKINVSKDISSISPSLMISKGFSSEIYRIKDMDFTIETSKNVNIVNVVLEKGEEVSVKYDGIDQSQLGNLPKTVIAFGNKINDNQIKNIPVGYKLGEISKIENKSVTVKLIKETPEEKTENVKIIYLVGGKEQSISSLPTIATIKEGSSLVTLKDLNVTLEGFKVEGGKQAFEVVRSTKEPVVKINLISETGIEKPGKDTKNISLVFEHGDKVVGSYSIDVNKTLKVLLLKDIKVPDGYVAVGTSFNIDYQKDRVTIKVLRKSESNSNGSVVTKPTTKPSTTTPSNKHVVKVQDFKGTVATTPGQYVTLYNAEGKAISGRRLAGDSNWAADKTMVRDGVKYYRVATNEWVKASDVYEYTASNAVVETAAGNYKKLFDSKGNIVSNRGLAAGTKWMTDKVALIQGEKMYRVATNEWLKVSDVK